MSRSERIKNDPNNESIIRKDSTYHDKGTHSDPNTVPQHLYVVKQWVLRPCPGIHRTRSLDNDKCKKGMIVHSTSESVSLNELIL